MIRPGTFRHTAGVRTWAPILCLVAVMVAISWGQTRPPRESIVQYRLIEGSHLVDDCLFCGRPTLQIPIDGTFVLIFESADPLFETFRVEDLRFTTHEPGGAYTGDLGGRYRVGGEVAVMHEMELAGSIVGREVELESGLEVLSIGRPWIEIDLHQVKPDPQETPMQVFSLHLVAVPWPQVAFSTEVGFTSEQPERGAVSAGDLLCTDGRVLRRNGDLMGRLGVQPIVPDVGLDAALRPRVPGSESDRCARRTWFSIETDIFSETLGPLHEGDLLSEVGWIVQGFEELIGPFGPMPPVADMGLDAVAQAVGVDASGPGGSLWFSVGEDFHSESLGRKVGQGDVLGSDGTIIKTNAELMAQFHPVEVPEGGFGLDALFVWPHGEVWFSTERDFVDRRLGPVGHGDLLSDRGRIVMRNRDLLRAFGPLEDLADFGLDALDVRAVVPRGDLDADGAVRLGDLAELARWYLEDWCIECGGADLDWDGRVALSDVRWFAEEWLTTCEGPRVDAHWSGCEGMLQEPSDYELRFQVEVRGRFVYFADRVPANCCAKGMDLQMAMEGRRIVIREVEIPGAPCDCICDYPVTAMLGPFEPGMYELEVWQETDAGHKLVGRRPVGIGPTMEVRIGPCDASPGAEPVGDEPRFSVEVDGAMLRFADRVRANCCADRVTLEMEVTGNVITLREGELLTTPCFCLCDYPVTAALGPFAPGVYLVCVEQETSAGSYSGQVEVTVGPGAAYQVLPCRGSKQAPREEPRFSAEVRGRYVYFADKVWANCCADRITLAVETEGDAIVVTETEHTTDPCRCMCDFPTKAVLGPFEPGLYTLAVWQTDREDSRLIGVVPIVIKGD